MEIQIRQGITIIVPGCRDAAITCGVNEDTDTLMQLKIAHFSSVAWPAYFTSIRNRLTWGWSRQVFKFQSKHYQVS